MEITSIPFVCHVGIATDEEERLVLSDSASVQNHIATVHAGALYTLAETQSGHFLQQKFSAYTIPVVPLLRHSSVKYKHPASGTIHSKAYADKEALVQFEDQLSRKGRAAVTVSVELFDDDAQTVMVGEFGWFVKVLPS